MRIVVYRMHIKKMITPFEGFSGTGDGKQTAWGKALPYA